MSTNDAAVSVVGAATGKKKAAAAPVFPFPEADHFSDYGFDPQLVQFLSQPETKRTSTTAQHQQPLESARFKLQKPISKKQHRNKQQQQRRRRWWSSAASAALFLFKRPYSSPKPTTTGAVSPASAAGPLYLADDDDDGFGNDSTTSCACWAPAMRSGHLAAAELGHASASVPYVSLRNANLGRGAAGGGAPPAMPIYLVT